MPIIRTPEGGAGTLVVIVFEALASSAGVEGGGGQVHSRCTSSQVCGKLSSPGRRLVVFL